MADAPHNPDEPTSDNAVMGQVHALLTEIHALALQGRTAEQLIRARKLITELGSLIGQIPWKMETEGQRFIRLQNDPYLQSEDARTIITDVFNVGPQAGTAIQPTNTEGIPPAGELQFVRFTPTVTIDDPERTELLTRLNALETGFREFRDLLPAMIRAAREHPGIGGNAGKPYDLEEAQSITDKHSLSKFPNRSSEKKLRPALPPLKSSHHLQPPA